MNLTVYLTEYLESRGYRNAAAYRSLSVREARTGNRQLDKRAIMRRLDAAIEASERSDVEYWFARRLDLSPLVGQCCVKFRHQPLPLFVPGLSSEVRSGPDGLLYVGKAKPALPF